MNFNWVPKESLGNLFFEESLDPLLLTEETKKVKEYSDDEPWEVFEFLNYGLRISVENDILISAECYEICNYNNVNIIGMKISEVIDFLGIKDPKKETLYEEYKITSDDLGIIIWSEKNVIVESVTVYQI